MSYLIPNTSLFLISMLLNLLLFSCSHESNETTKQNPPKDSLMIWQDILVQLDSFAVDHMRPYNEEDSSDIHSIYGEPKFYIDTVLRPDVNGDKIKDYFISGLIDPPFSLYRGYFFDGKDGTHIESSEKPYARFFMDTHMLDVLCQDQRDEIMISRGISTVGMLLEVYRLNDSTSQMEEIFGLGYDIMGIDSESGLIYCSLFDPSQACFDTIYTYDGIYKQDTSHTNLFDIQPTSNVPQNVYVYDQSSGRYLEQR